MILINNKTVNQDLIFPLIGFKDEYCKSEFTIKNTSSENINITVNPACGSCTTVTPGSFTLAPNSEQLINYKIKKESVGNYSTYLNVNYIGTSQSGLPQLQKKVFIKYEVIK
jgi:hypothetical protein